MLRTSGLRLGSRALCLCVGRRRRPGVGLVRLRSAAFILILLTGLLRTLIVRVALILLRPLTRIALRLLFGPLAPTVLALPVLILLRLRRLPRARALWAAMSDDPTYLAQLEPILEGLRKAGVPEE